MRRVLISLSLVGLLAAGCSDDEPEATGEETATSSTEVEVKRLDCPRGVRTFQVTGAAIGHTRSTYASADEAAQGVVDEDAALASYVELGADPAGVRYALLDAAGDVVSEVVVSEEGGEWATLLLDSCA